MVSFFKQRLADRSVGAFCISWVALNLNGVFTFLLVDIPQKINIIQNKEWSILSDFLFPLGWSLFVFVLFQIIGWLLDSIEAKVSKHRAIESKKKTLIWHRAKEAQVLNEYDSRIKKLTNAKYELSENIRHMSCNLMLWKEEMNNEHYQVLLHHQRSLEKCLENIEKNDL